MTRPSGWASDRTTTWITYAVNAIEPTPVRGSSTHRDHGNRPSNTRPAISASARPPEENTSKTVPELGSKDHSACCQSMPVAGSVVRSIPVVEVAERWTSLNSGAGEPAEITNGAAKPANSTRPATRNPLSALTLSRPKRPRAMPARTKAIHTSAGETVVASRVGTKLPPRSGEPYPQVGIHSGNPVTSSLPTNARQQATTRRVRGRQRSAGRERTNQKA